MTDKSPIEQAREFLVGYEDGLSCTPFPNKHTATLADHLRQVIDYAESLERYTESLERRVMVLENLLLKKTGE